jgi:hypothetical protein
MKKKGKTSLSMMSFVGDDEIVRLHNTLFSVRIHRDSRPIIRSKWRQRQSTIGVHIATGIVGPSVSNRDWIWDFGC